MKKLVINVLVDNTAGAHYRAEHGLSLFIDTGDKKILFDTGQSNLFMENAEKLSVSVNDAEIIILSHGHFDHGNGLEYLRGGILICHPGCFIPRYRENGHENIGLKRELSYYSNKYNLITSREPVKLSERITFLGEIPRETSFENRATSFKMNDGSPDFVVDDSAVAVETEEGLFIVTGCGHAGIVNTVIHAKKVTGVKRLAGVMGGFHLKDCGLQTLETINYLCSEKARYIIPMHCTELPALSAFYEKFRTRQVRTGDTITFRQYQS
jgi:7,8-dihydropterin-6-yl-methyl-4-(beta-D-ribofuranosyl)aminobenzene 5'-phosphate synthase